MERNLYLVSLVFFKNLGNGQANIGNHVGLVWARNESEALGFRIIEAQKNPIHTGYQLHLTEVVEVNREDLIDGREEWFGIKKDV